MPASIYAWLPEEREDEERKQLLEGLYRELDECTEVKITTRNRLKIFLPERGIWHIWDIDYAVRQEYEKRDAWIQVYQYKMKNYKKVPIPLVLYKLMKVYIRKNGILPEEYVFQNSTGGAYLYGTFRKQMMKYCEKYGIGDGTYQFKSHDYRHTLATMFYDNGTSIQSVRDYLGHDFEEMTQQYIDYMPKKISKANKEYLSKEENSLAAGIKRCKRGK